MEETIETPTGGHYARCGEMAETNQSNKFIRVTECTNCGDTRVQSNGLTDLVILILTIGTTASAYGTEFTAPPHSIQTLANVYPALGVILAVLAMIIGVYTHLKLDQGVLIEGD